ncbi:sodium-dependent lysophosphatidylcholine symporter 1-like isoform X2 [Brachyhypopomus gauderio]|uniref:sodium-dependent lysophosphatidylcholine symporter 1-like isoform X2 n=1 Tax=Brachyhypopomus gauderio TaxID=698409 RepID=UPI004042CA62
MWCRYKMSAFYVSIILFLGRAWDAVTDPLVGYAVSRTGRTRFGKLIPWMVYTAPMGILSYVMLWYTPQDTMSTASSFCWYLTWCCLFDAFMSCYHVPYTSLNMFLGGDQRDRDSATGYRMGMEMFATLAGAMIQGQTVGIYHAKRTKDCSMLNASQTLAANLTSPLTDTLQNTRRAYLIAALALGAFYFLCCLTLFIGVKEQLAPLSRLDRSTVPYRTSMKMVMTHTSYVRLVFAFLFTSLAFQMTQGVFALFCTYAGGMGAYFQHLMLILLSVATLSVPAWQILLIKLGKKTTVFIGLSSYIPGLTILYFVKDSFPVFATAAVLNGSSLACLYLLPWSMLPDAVDDFKVKNPSYMDLEPMFYACFVFFNKFGGGVSSGVSTLALHFAGYQSGQCRQNPRVVTTLRVIFVPVPISLLLIGLVLFIFYPINEERRQKIKAKLKAAAEMKTHRRSICEEFRVESNEPQTSL